MKNILKNNHNYTSIHAYEKNKIHNLHEIFSTQYHN